MELKFVICGLEHTGTTLVSDLFRQAPGVDSGFETGVLLCDSPRDFRGLEPFCANVLNGWGLSDAEFATCCEAPDFATFYARLAGFSRVIGADTATLFDKTPRYVSRLPECLAKVDVPFIVTHKDPVAIVASDFRRAGGQDFGEWYAAYMPAKKRYIQTCYLSWQREKANPRLCSIALEDLALNARATMARMFAHVGLGFDIRYALMSGLRYQHTRANTVSAGIVFEYLRLLSKDQQARIRSDFSEFSDWFYS